MIAVIGIAGAKVKVKLGIPEKKPEVHEHELIQDVPPEMSYAYEEAMRSRDELWDGVGREQGVFGGYDSVEPENGDEITTEFRGTAYKVACHLAEAGEKVKFISLDGKDLMGDALSCDLEERGVDTSCLRKVEGKTPVEVQVVNFLNDLQFSRADGVLGDSLTPEIIDEYSEVLTGASAVMVDGTLPERTLQHISDVYGGKTKIVFDPGTLGGAEKVKLRKSDALSGMYCIVPGRMEAETMCGRSILGRDKLAEAAGLFIDKGVKMTVITMKGGGLYYSTGEEENIIKPERVLGFAEPEGAGDVLTAAVVRGVAQKLAPGEICSRAMEVTADYLKDIKDEF